MSSLAISIIVGLLSGGISFVAGRWSKKYNHKMVYARIDDLKKQIKEQKELSEKYKKIAATHEISFPKAQEEVELFKLDFRGTMAENLVLMKNALPDFRVNVEIDIWVLGDWKEYFRVNNCWVIKSDDPNSSFVKLGLPSNFVGNKDKIMQEFEHLIKNRTFGFWNSTTKKWNVEDGTVCIQVKVKGKPQKPEELNVVYVEVLVEESKDNTDVLLRQAEEEIERLERHNVKLKTALEVE